MDMDVTTPWEDMEREQLTCKKRVTLWGHVFLGVLDWLIGARRLGRQKMHEWFDGWMKG